MSPAEAEAIAHHLAKAQKNLNEVQVRHVLQIEGHQDMCDTEIQNNVDRLAKSIEGIELVFKMAIASLKE